MNNNYSLNSIGNVFSDYAGEQARNAPATHTVSCSESPHFTVICEYGQDGRICRKTEQGPDFEDLYSYQYDQSGHLATVCHNGKDEEEYRFNPSGQRVFQKVLWSGPRQGRSLHQIMHGSAFGGQTLEYNKLGQLERFGGMQSFGYDAQGNVSAAGITHIGRKVLYQYMNDTCLESARYPNGDEVRFEYGLRGKLSVCPSRKFLNGKLVAEYAWSSPKRLTQCIDHVQGIEFNFIYSSANSHSPNILNLHILRATHLNLHLFAMLGQEKTATIYCGCDQVGTLKLVTDQNGRAIKRIQYDSFGNIISETEPEFRLPIGFAGGLQDYDTGLVILGHRAYDPVIGRFMSKDPLGDTGGEGDLYDYCIDDPVNMVDSDGLSPAKFIGKQIGKAIAGYLIGGGPLFPKKANDYKDRAAIMADIAAVEKEIKRLESLRQGWDEAKNTIRNIEKLKHTLRELNDLLWVVPY